ncbi:endolytic transglycosylase MltG [Pedomonas mirosovicensis]|uniref:endolytic transglycosylase MltG n=1 Tax=Pedomonas mirosovicensis TaxID=2908641 RepID=UPI00216A4C92|nr:endolytic transglycosylase MltG [Pedomonas mirosovicensis]MCH8685664.1 endolytic transglycosylase MltG [Pedomonas mirosovicensis]
MALTRKQKWITGIVGLFLSLALVVVLWFGSQAYRWKAPGPSTRDTVVLVEEGSSLTRAAQSLEKAGVVADAHAFLKMARWFGSDQPIKAGEYAMPAGVSPSQVLRLLQEGAVLLRRITVVEGMSAIQIYERLMGEEMLTGPVAVPEEGSVLPETYSFVRGETRQSVLDRMQASMRQTLDELWAARDPDLPLKTPQEAVILASIVEKETSLKREMPEVAGVYINRLKIGMKLQADPTVIYPITQGKPLGRRIRLSDLRAENAYNTYVIEGLPAGPIANPSRAALKAVLKPAKTKNLYFVADGTGGHRFAATHAEHLRNVAHWRQFRVQNGI